jgi:O-antigen/teichoic acid export membrane protein
MANRLYLAASIFIRMGGALAIYALLARGLGPTNFGFVSAVLVYAGLAGIFTDFGFTIRSLRDIAANPDEGGPILAAALSVKAALTGLVILAGLIALFCLHLTPAMRITAALLGTGLMLGTIGDLALVAYRSMGRYSSETWIVSGTSGVYIAIMAPIALLHAGPVVVGVGYFLSRFVHFTVSLISVGRLFPNHKLQISSVRGTLRSMGDSTSWAMDTGLTYLNIQIDGLLVVPFLGLAQAGIYLAGSRLVQASLALNTVLSNIHIPRLAAEQNAQRMSRNELRMMAEFLAMGVVLALIFLLGGPLITRFLLGGKFVGVNRLWPGFAAFLIARVSAASFGASLSVLGKPLLRVTGQLTGLVGIIIGFAVFVPRYGIVAGPWVMAAGSAVQCMIFGSWRLSMLRPVAHKPEPGASVGGAYKIKAQPRQDESR